MKRLVLLLAVALSSADAVQAAPREMVAAAHPLAVEAGLTALRNGGSAIDAAVAVQMVLGVVEPQASGLGGGGFLLYYDATSHAITVYDGRETAPAGATPTMFLAADGKPLPFREAVASGLSVGVPGAVALLELAHKEHGKRPWRELFEPAIALAREPVLMAGAMRQGVDAGRAAYLAGRIPKLGEASASSPLKGISPSS